MIKRLAIFAPSLLTLSALGVGGCASVSPEARLRTGLIEAGLSPRVAGCMAERMADRLSIAQLKRLKSLASLKDAQVETLTVGQFLHKVRGLQDMELIEVTTRAGLGCALSG